MAAAIPNCELLVIEGASHTAPIERPTLVDSTIRDFFARRIDVKAGSPLP
jgi:pimeloyl-ACP methyl ester carboxylesterase